jgi:Pyrimidine reductase, riboflavin biosynthesis
MPDRGARPGAVQPPDQPAAVHDAGDNRGVSSTEPAMRRLWPVADPGPLSDEDIVAAYPAPAGQRLLRVNFVSSVDGAVTLDGRSGPLGGPGDRRILGLLRVNCDAVLVAAGTVRVEGYSPLRTAEARRRLRIERGRTPDPVLVLVTRRLGFDPADPRFTQAPQRPVVLTTEETAQRVGNRFADVADVIGVGHEDVDLGAGLDALAERGLVHVLCEGGPHLFGSLIAADLVDELCLTLAPKLVGPGPERIVAGPDTAVRTLALTQILAAGDELFLRYTRTRPSSSD